MVKSINNHDFPHLNVQVVAVLQKHCVPSRCITIEVLLFPSDHGEFIDRDVKQPPFDVSLQAAILGPIPLLQYLRSEDGIGEHHIRHEEIVLMMKAVARLMEDLRLLRVRLVQINGITRCCVGARILTGDLVDIIQHPSLAVDGLFTRNRRWMDSGHVPWSIVTTLHSVWTRPSDTTSRVDVRATLPSALNVINASSVGKLVQLVNASRLTLNHKGRVDPMKDECHYQIKH